MRKPKTFAGIIVLFGLLILVFVAIIYAQPAFFVNNIVLEEQRVVVSQNVLEELDMIYHNGITTEVPVCLAGDVRSDGIYVFDLFMPEIVESSEDSVTFVSCPPSVGPYSVIGTMHNHPGGSCFLSSTDVDTYVNSMIFDSQVLVGLKCQTGYTYYFMSQLEAEVGLI